jgi:hypothetical protein
MSAEGERAAARPRDARLRRVATFDGKVAARASATTAADLHHPVAAAAGRYCRGNGLAPAEHHVRAVPRRLRPHAPSTLLGPASDRDILGNGARRPAMPHEARMIEAVAASHIVGVLLSERVERGTIGMALAGAVSAEQQCESKADDTKRHDTNLAFQRAYDCSRDRRRPQFIGDGYNFPAFTTMSIKQPMVALPMSAPGHLRPSHSAPVLDYVRCWSNSDRFGHGSEMSLNTKRRHRACDRAPLIG